MIYMIQDHLLNPDLFELESKGSISIDEVESEEEIMKRFRTGAMSHGGYTEAQEAVIAMN